MPSPVISHAVMIKKLKLRYDGNYLIQIAETSPSRIAQAWSSDLFKDLGPLLWFNTFYPR